ncbi:MAG: hypothetical protein Q4A96_00910 [Candidatus Saccharibacteria bacterium]|nr:hypothetical protein [Candidatus Saccharibacteria bacterium]
MDGIKRRGANATINHSSSIDHRRVQKSTTLNRRFVKRPVLSKTTTARQVTQVAKQQQAAQQQATQRTTTQQLRKHSATRATAAKARVVTAKSQQQLIARQKRVRLQPISSAKTQQQQQRQQQQGIDRVSMQATRAIAQKQQEIVSLKNAQQQQSGYAQAAQQAAAKYANLSAQQQARMAQSPIARNARARVQYKNQQQEHISAKEMKDKAIQKALHDVATMQQEQEEYQPKRRFWQKRGFLISGAVAIISIALLGYLVYLNLPDLSVRVAAMQTGIENAYPSYVPMNYRLSGLVKEDNGVITMNFVQENGGSFQLIEKKSSWDSATVLSNFVEEKWGSDYVVAKGQGLTVYISGSNAVWVNGGVLYQIEDHGSNLTTDDLHDIAISL